MKNIFLVFITFFLALNFSVFGQSSEEFWKVLEKINFEKKYDKNLKVNVDYPVFNEAIKKLEGEIIEVIAYALPFKTYAVENQDFIIVTKNRLKIKNYYFLPVPDDLTKWMQVYLKNKDNYQQYDEKKITIKGKLKLNSSDLNHLMYILEEAEVISIEEN